MGCCHLTSLLTNQKQRFSDGTPLMADQKQRLSDSTPLMANQKQRFSDGPPLITNHHSDSVTTLHSSLTISSGSVTAPHSSLTINSNAGMKGVKFKSELSVIDVDHQPSPRQSHRVRTRPLRPRAKVPLITDLKQITNFNSHTATVTTMMTSKSMLRD